MRFVLCSSIVALGMGACTAQPPSTAAGSIEAFGQAVEYTVDGKTMEGYWASPGESEAIRPAVLIVHDWNGIDDHERGVADRLARMGYNAFCADIYGKGVRPKNVQESQAEASKYYADNALLRKRALGALEFLKRNDVVNKNRIAAIGYCFGGMTVLEMARAGADLRGVVSFHGSLATPSPMVRDVYRGKVLILHGADDPLVPQ